MTPIILSSYKNFNYQKINFSDPFSESDNIFLCNIPSKNRLLFQTPMLITLDSIKLKQKECKLSLSLDNTDVHFLNFLKEIDNYCISYCKSKSRDWFSQDLELDVIDDFYENTLKFNIDKENNNIINYLDISIEKLNNIPNINIYDNQRHLLNWKRIKPNKKIIAIIELKGLIFSKKCFQANWEIVQLKAEIKKQNINLTELLSDNNTSKDISKFKNENYGDLILSEDTNSKNSTYSDVVEKIYKIRKIVPGKHYNKEVIDTEMLNDLAQSEIINEDEILNVCAD